MREVTLYRAQPETMMATGDFVEFRQATDLGRLSVIRSTGEYCETIEKVQLPIIPLCHSHEPTEYVAVDKTLDRLIAAYRNSAKDAESARARAESFLHEEVGRRCGIETKVAEATLWQRIKAVFCGGRALL